MSGYPGSGRTHRSDADRRKTEEERTKEDGLLVDREDQRDEEDDDHHGEREEGIPSLGDRRQKSHRSPFLAYAGPYQGGAVPPVSISLRLFSSRSRNGR